MYEKLDAKSTEAQLVKTNQDLIVQFRKFMNVSNSIQVVNKQNINSLSQDTDKVDPISSI